MTQEKGGFLLHCHPDGRIREVVNDSLGLVPPEMIGRPFTALAAPGALAKALDFFRAIEGQGAQYYWEIPVGRRSMVFVGAKDDGGLAIAASSTPDGVDALIDDLMRVSNDQANLIRSMTGDRSHNLSQGDGALEELTRLNIEFANMQRELARKNAELARANDRKGLMLGMAAHDLRNPLQVISGFAEYLKTRAADRLDASEQRFLDHILESSARMLSIIEDVLQVSQSETGKLVLSREPADLVALVEDTALLQASIAQTKRIAIDTVVASHPGLVEVDVGKLRQVLDNLLGNAVKFSPPDTRIEVGLTTVGDEVLISVIDQGPGIPAHELPRLFQPFSRTSVRPTGGEPSTGLGLAIGKSIVEGHGGRLTVDSQVGCGTTFTLRLPRRPARLAQSPSSA
jgi:signal transduction histidine kinase